MYLITRIFGFLCLISLCRITEADSKFSSYFIELKLTLSKSKAWLTKAYSKIESYMPAFHTFPSSLFHKNIKSFTLVADKIFENLYDRFNYVVSYSENFLVHLTMNSSFWNCWLFKEYHKSCSLFNATTPDYLIKHELYGQHLILWSVNEFLKTHLNNNHPLKPLVMSFHGPTGCGKSFASKMIAETLYQDGLSSKYVHVYHGDIDFCHEKKKVLYQKRLLKDIYIFTSICKKSLFIFDEIDKMVPGVIDVLVPYLLFDKRSSKLDLRKSIFIFISNIGSSRIQEITYDAWFNGASREDITIEDISSQLKDAAYNNPNGLQYSELVNKNLIDVFVPFLPLEKKHVKQCIVKELKSRELSFEEEIVERVASQLVYNPAQFQIFSASGCKRVAHKVDIYGENYI